MRDGERKPEFPAGGSNRSGVQAEPVRQLLGQIAELDPPPAFFAEPGAARITFDATPA
jgi:hypothetical protein